tara:strand:- start:232 stop:759 length:528 start_codon:yes stop_codon:yes gene_type:complete
MIIDRLIKLALPLALFSPLTGFAQEENEEIIHIHCNLDNPAFEGSTSYNAMLFHLNTTNLTWSSSNLINAENKGEGETASEEDIEEWENKKARMDNPYGYTNFIVEYNTYTLESLLGEIVLNRVEGTVARLDTPNPSISTFSGTCTSISREQAIEIYDSMIERIKTDRGGRTQLF